MGVQYLLTCLLRNLYVGQVSTTGHGTSNWFKTGKGIWQGYILLPYLFNFYVECIIWNARWDNRQAGIKITRRNSDNLRNAGDTTLMVESGEELNNLLMKWKRREKKLEWNSTLKNKLINKIMASSPSSSWQIEWGKVEAVYIGLLKSVNAALKLIDTCSLKEKLWQT